jgi:putative ABC transport system substrate-binding protein
VIRREFLAGAVGAGVLAPLIAAAQSRAKTPRVGVLWHAGSAEEEAIYLGAFEEGLKGLGYIDGRTVRLEHRFPNEQPDRFLSQAAELAALDVDILVAVTRPAALAAQRATRTIPIVFIVVPDPVGSKLVDSLARPGGNITGLTHIAVELSAKRLEFLKEIIPRLSRAALVVNANDVQGMRRYIEETQVAADRLQVTVELVEVRSLGDFEPAFDKILASRVQGVVVPADGLFYQGRALMAQSALTRRLPLMVYSRETLDAGGLGSYGADQRVIFRRAAAYIDKIVKGAKPAQLPVEQPTRFEFILNLRTAKILGLTIPQTLLLRADQLIE